MRKHVSDLKYKTLENGYTDRQAWTCLKKCWKGFNSARDWYGRSADKEKMYKYARAIHRLSKQLGLVTYTFTDFDFDFKLTSCNYKKPYMVYPNLRSEKSAPLQVLENDKCFYRPVSKDECYYKEEAKRDGRCWYGGNNYRNKLERQQYYYQRAKRKWNRRSCVYVKSI